MADVTGKSPLGLTRTFAARDTSDGYVALDVRVEQQVFHISDCASTIVYANLSPLAALDLANALTQAARNVLAKKEINA